MRDHGSSQLPILCSSKQYFLWLYFPIIFLSSHLQLNKWLEFTLCSTCVQHVLWVSYSPSPLFSLRVTEISLFLINISVIFVPIFLETSSLVICSSQLHSQYPSVKQNFSYLKFPLKYMKEISSVHCHIYYRTVEQALFLKHFSCLLMLCLALGRHLSLFWLNFGFRCHIFHHLLKHFLDS